MPAIRPEPRLARFSVRVAMSCPSARVPWPCGVRAVAPPEDPAEAPIGAPLGDLPAPRLVVNPKTVTMKTPSRNTQSIISTGPMPSSSSTAGAR